MQLVHNIYMVGIRARAHLHQKLLILTLHFLLKHWTWTVLCRRVRSAVNNRWHAASARPLAYAPHSHRKGERAYLCQLYINVAYLPSYRSDKATLIYRLTTL